MPKKWGMEMGYTYLEQANLVFVGNNKVKEDPTISPQDKARLIFTGKRQIIKLLMDAVIEDVSEEALQMLANLERIKDEIPRELRSSVREFLARFEEDDNSPSSSPSRAPTSAPTLAPTSDESENISVPSSIPSAEPSSIPTIQPSGLMLDIANYDLTDSFVDGHGNCG